MEPKTTKRPESVVREIKRKTAANSIPRKKSESYWKALKAKTVSLPFADVRASDTVV